MKALDASFWRLHLPKNSCNWFCFGELLKKIKMGTFRDTLNNKEIGCAWLSFFWVSLYERNAQSVIMHVGDSAPTKDVS